MGGMGIIKKILEKVPRGTLAPDTSCFGGFLLPVLASYSFTCLTFCQGIALHNVSYSTLSGISLFLIRDIIPAGV
jgi:hypothetical protein